MGFKTMTKDSRGLIGIDYNDRIEFNIINRYGNVGDFGQILFKNYNDEGNILNLINHCHDIDSRFELRTKRLIFKKFDDYNVEDFIRYCTSGIISNEYKLDFSGGNFEDCIYLWRTNHWVIFNKVIFKEHNNQYMFFNPETL